MRSRSERPCQYGITVFSYASRHSGGTRYQVSGRESRIRRSSSEWQVSSG